MSLPGLHTPAAGFEAPFEMLGACHERVQRMLTLLTRLQAHHAVHGCDDQARDAARDVMRYFDMAAPLHHQDEELHVFPVLAAHGDAAQQALVRKLQDDHRRMEQCWPQVRTVLEAIRLAQAPQPLSEAQSALLAQFKALYVQHLPDEDQLAYPAAAGWLDAAALRAMSEDMMRRRGV